MARTTPGRLAGAVAAALLLTQLLSGCGGGEQARQAPAPALSLRLHGPAQVRPGDTAQLTGTFAGDSAVPASTSWALIERPEGSRATLDASGSGSVNALRTDVAGRYVVEWSASGADGQQVRRQWVVQSVDGPLVQPVSGLDTLRVGASDLLHASPPAGQDDGAFTYRWQLLQAPAGSRAQLSGHWGEDVALTPDIAGEYRIEVEARLGNTITRTVRTLSALPAGPVLAFPHTRCPAISSRCQRFVGTPIDIQAELNQPIGTAKVNFRWSLLELPAASKLSNLTGVGRTFQLTPDAVGEYLVNLSASSSDIRVDGSMVRLTVVEKPVGTIKAPPTARVNQLIELDASMNRTDNGEPISEDHCWTVTKAPAGSTAQVQPACAWSSKTQFRPDRSGDYTISLSLRGINDYASVSIRAIAADPQQIYPANVTGDLGLHIPGEVFELKAEAQVETGNPLAYEWRWGDGTTSTGESGKHAYGFPANYEVQVVATDTVTRRSSRKTFTAKVLTSRLDNIPPVPCKTPPCPAESPGRYAGSGLGHWRLTNDSALSKAVNLDIAGMTEGKQVLVSLTNASAVASGTAELGIASGADPVSYFLREGGSTVVGRTQARTASLARRDEAHAKHLERNQALVRSLPVAASRPQGSEGRRTRLSVEPRQAAPIPELGTIQSWRDVDSGRTYASRLAATCTMPGGRPIYFWIDEAAHANGLIDQVQIANDFRPVACGEQGVFQRIQKVLDAEVFGPHGNAEMIDDHLLQPVHVAFVDPLSDVGWGAYVSYGNLWRKSRYKESNEALLVTMNARMIKRDLNFLKSALGHEFMHLMNFYQRNILNGQYMHESWLEETTAMMAEDLVSSSVISNPDGSPYAPMSLRLSSYRDWDRPHRYFNGDYADYGVGGSLAAYLDRRLGAKLLQRLTFECLDTGQNAAGYRCLDDQVFALSGRGVAEGFSALNASLVGEFNEAEGPDLGLPAYTSDAVQLPAIDLKKNPWPPSAYTRGPLILWEGSHVYQWDAVNDSAEGRYRRKGILVPPGHVLQVLVR